MNRYLITIVFLLGSALLTYSTSCTSVKGKEIKTALCLYPENPHYFLFRGKPALLIGSTEHYGAVMNPDFDYKVYLNEIHSSGLNITRVFSGIYVEPAGAFNIKKNTLAPASGRFIAPWARSPVSGYANGGNKFDLEKWDEAYFSRLKDFVLEAGKKDIVVELDLFSNFYDTIQWKLSPLYVANNINAIGNIKDWKEILSLKHPEILEIQSRMVRKIISELKDFDNLYYEICNEPYFGDTLALREWETYMTGVAFEAEKDFKDKHLISNNIANNSKVLSVPREHVSIYNFHYAHPPAAVTGNYHLNSAIGDNETGFDGTGDDTYRKEAWNFIMSGGAVFNNLDYSFTSDNEDGTFVVEEGQPGGGGKTLRNQFKILADFMKGIDFVNMKPATDDILVLTDSTGTSFRALSGKSTLAVYFSRNDTVTSSTNINISLQPGSYELTWINTRTADQLTVTIMDYKGGWMEITSPRYRGDIALKVEEEE